MPDEKKSNDERQGNTVITDFEKEVQQKALEQHEMQRDEQPRILDQVSGKIADAIGRGGADADLSMQGIRDKLHNVVKGGEANEENPGKLSADDSETEPGKTVPTKVMREGADEEQGKDLNRSRFKE